MQNRIEATTLIKNLFDSNKFTNNIFINVFNIKLLEHGLFNIRSWKNARIKVELLFNDKKIKEQKSDFLVYFSYLVCYIKEEKRILYNKIINFVFSDDFSIALNKIDKSITENFKKGNWDIEKRIQSHSKNIEPQNESILFILLTEIDLRNSRRLLNFWFILPFLENFSIKDFEKLEIFDSNKNTVNGPNIIFCILENLRNHLDPIIYFWILAIYFSESQIEQIKFKSIFHLINKIYNSI